MAPVVWTIPAGQNELLIPAADLNEATPNRRIRIRVISGSVDFTAEAMRADGVPQALNIRNPRTPDSNELDVILFSLNARNTDPNGVAIGTFEDLTAAE